MYKLNKDFITGQDCSVNRIEDGKTTCIPFDPENRDYRQYLEWLAEGNTPEPADE
jgi:hypothetical protein